MNISQEWGDFNVGSVEACEWGAAGGGGGSTSQKVRTSSEKCPLERCGYLQNRYKDPSRQDFQGAWRGGLHKKFILVTQAYIFPLKIGVCSEGGSTRLPELEA